jgi:hypothetical protein
VREGQLALQPVHPIFLKPDQLRAFGIVEKHLDITLAGASPSQLLMQVQGEGGTGKSMVIHCITELFRRRGVEKRLVKSAYTGIAASLIDGNTLHTLCHLTSRRTEMSQKVLDVLRRTWKDVDYLIIDEVSMISCEFLARVSGILSAAKQASDQPPNSLPFGGINVIILGDFHQFPPVACPLCALYWPNNPAQDSPERMTGRKIYESFRTVVILQEQCRTTDPIWRNVLQHAREGTCMPEHLATIRSLVVANPADGSVKAKVDDPRWQDAVLVTPRHGVRIAWNEMAVRRHCAKHGKQLFMCPAEDTIGNRSLTIAERLDAAKKKTKTKADRVRKDKGNLPDVVELAVGMEVMVTFNVQTDLDVANGARGVVERVILDCRETISSQTTVLAQSCVRVRRTH